MREILFRGKNATDNNWVYGFFTNQYVTSDTITMPPVELSTIVIESGEHIVIDYKSIGQYTGMKDKNGVRVFEGDILKNTLDNSISVVEWSEAHTGFTLKTRGTIYGFPKIGHEVYKIIGNIYDNPELLEGDKT